MDFPAQPDYAPAPYFIPGDWRLHLAPDSRHRMVHKISETLKKHYDFPGQEGLLKIKQAAVNFEETCYTAAANQSAYLRDISRRMLALEATRNRQDIEHLSIHTPTSTSTYLFETEPNIWRPALQEPPPNDPEARE